MNEDTNTSRPSRLTAGLREANSNNGSRSPRLLGRLLGRLRGDHHKQPQFINRSSFEYSIKVESTDFPITMTNDSEEETPKLLQNSDKTASSHSTTSKTEEELFSKVDSRYGGQYLTPNQLPEFCDQLHNLVEIIRNIKSYAKVTGEYPRHLEQSLEREAREVAALAAEVRNARDVVTRTNIQRRALRENRTLILAQLTLLKETETRELESAVRLSDRKLYKAWEVVKDSSDPTKFDPLLDDISNKQNALDSLKRLIKHRLLAITHNSSKIIQKLSPQPLFPPDTWNEEQTTASASTGQRRLETNKRTKRRQKEREPTSLPLSSGSSFHGPQPQVTLCIQNAENTSRFRISGSTTDAVTLTPVQLRSHGSIRDILFYAPT